MKNHLELSPELAGYLAQNGLLDALIWHYKHFKEQQYFPFREKDKRVTKLAVWKGLCQIAATRSLEDKKANPMTTDDILAETERITGMICPETKAKGYMQRASKTVAQINAELQIQTDKERAEEQEGTQPSAISQPSNKPAKKPAGSTKRASVKK